MSEFSELESYYDVTIGLKCFSFYCDITKGLSKFVIIAMSQFKELESYCDVTIELIYFLTHWKDQPNLKLEWCHNLKNWKVIVTSQLDFYIFKLIVTSLVD